MGTDMSNLPHRTQSELQRCRARTLPEKKDLPKPQVKPQVKMEIRKGVAVSYSKFQSA